MLLTIGFVVLVALAGLATSLLSSRLLVWDRGRLLPIPRLLKPQSVRLEALPAIMEAMSQGSAKVRYAGLTFHTPDRPDTDPVNLNLSYENETIGFEWVLLARRNLQDQEAFKAFAVARGVEPIACSLNGVSCLRVECGDVAKFTASIVTGMYQRPSTERLEIVHEGFDWPRP